MGISRVMPRLGQARRPDDADGFVPGACVDTLYDYTQILGEEPIARFPEGAPPAGSVAVIGAGPAGLVAAYELLRAGAVPVVFEATDRVGGRNWTRYFTERGEPTNVIAEMGAMRMPASNKVFWHYADLLGMRHSPFPDPGTVPTTLCYANTAYRWAPGNPPPGPFGRLQADLDRFIDPLLDAIWTPWRREDGDGVRRLWQGYIDRYANTSFFEAVKEGIPHWTTEDFSAFGALGIGTGGFGPLYEINFLEILRVLVHRWEVDQRLLQFGVGPLFENLYSRQVALPDGRRASLRSLDAVLLNAPVSGLERTADGRVRIVYRHPATRARAAQEASAVVVATTTRSMEITLGLTEPNSALTSDKVKDALRDLHMMDSSKLFIRTRTKFWLDGGGKPVREMPQNIQTDELPRGVYCLDYPQTDNGVVLMSYTWGDDSSKLLGLDPPTRFAKIKQVLGNIHPEFAANLVPVGGEILCIDWEAEPYYFGAFKLHYPGQEPALHAAYYQFLNVLDPSADTGVYLAGDGVSWSGGWTEGALQTGLNAACAAARRLGGTLPAHSPLTQDPNRYRYGS